MTYCVATQLKTGGYVLVMFTPPKRLHNSRLVSLSYSVSGGTGLGFSLGSSKQNRHPQHSENRCSTKGEPVRLQSVALSPARSATAAMVGLGLVLSFQLRLKGVASRFAKAQIAPGKVAITYPRWRRSLKVSSSLARAPAGSGHRGHRRSWRRQRTCKRCPPSRPLSGGGQSMCILGRRTDAALKGRANARKERL